MTWQIGRLERDVNISIETLALFIRSWLIVAPSLPTAPKSPRTRGRQLAKGESLIREVSNDMADETERQHESKIRSQFIAVPIIVSSSSNKQVHRYLGEAFALD